MISNIALDLKRLPLRARHAIDRKIRGGNRPSVFILGAQKAGTTSLFNYLNTSKQLTGSQVKEMHFFDREDRYRRGYAWYESFFVTKRPSPQIYFEASPSYLYSAGVAKRIYKYNSSAKHIVVLRDPVERAYSAWNMYRSLARGGGLPIELRRFYKNEFPKYLYQIFFMGGSPTFSEYMDIELGMISNKTSCDGEEPSILRRGIYKPQIERYINYFGQDNVKIVGFSDLQENLFSTLNDVASFIGSDIKLSISETKSLVHNRGNYGNSLNVGDKTRLNQFYADANEALWQYLGRRINW